MPQRSHREDLGTREDLTLAPPLVEQLAEAFDRTAVALRLELAA